jgi:transcriptional regulator with XRE-family HTH domain
MYAYSAYVARPAYERVGTAFRTAYQGAGLRQEDIAAELGVDQGTVSKWARGLQRIDLDYFPRIDALCRQPTGHVLRLAGYVDFTPDVVAALTADTRLPDIPKQMLIDAYRAAVNLSAASDAPAHKAPKPATKAAN